MTAPPKRRWFRFSLRTMFVVVTLAAIPLGWAAQEWQVVSERKQVATWINKINHDADPSVTDGVGWGSVRQGLVRRILDDRFASWVYVVPRVTEAERDRIERAFPEAKLFIPVEKRLAGQP